jgi:hypothetical protein
VIGGSRSGGVAGHAVYGDGDCEHEGWVAGLVVVSVIILVVTGGADTSEAETTGIEWGKLIFGLLFLAMAARQWQQRPREGEPATMPKWMSSIDSFSAGKSLVLGAALSGVNPKNLALTAAAAASISEAGLSTGQSAAAVAVFVVLGSLTVVGPVLFYLIAPGKAAGPLESIKNLMSDHNAVIMMVVLLILGAKLIGQGLAGVTN